MVACKSRHPHDVTDYHPFLRSCGTWMSNDTFEPNTNQKGSGIIFLRRRVEDRINELLQQPVDSDEEDNVTLAGHSESRQRRNRQRRRPHWPRPRRQEGAWLRTAEAKVKALYRKCSEDSLQEPYIKGVVQRYLSNMTRAKDMARPLKDFEDDDTSITRWRSALSMIAAPLFSVQVR